MRFRFTLINRSTVHDLFGGNNLCTRYTIRMLEQHTLVLHAVLTFGVCLIRFDVFIC